MNKNIPAIFAMAVLMVSCTVGAPANVALRCTATASSSYDNNLTAQLLTDGICGCTEPAYMELVTSEGTVDKVERENTIDGDLMSRNIITGDSGWMEYRFHGYCIHADKAEILYQEALAGGRGGPKSTETIAVRDSAGTIRMDLKFPHSGRWRIKNVRFLSDDTEVTGLMPSEHFSSAWMSAGCEDEWVMVDLGGVHSIRGLAMHWISRPQNCVVELSRDGTVWKTKASQAMDELNFRAKARYVRIRMSGGPDRYCMSELEVFGAKEEQAAADWMLQRESEVAESGEALSCCGYDCAGWIPATVPGTILSSFIDAGAVPDPDRADNWAQISESYFLSDFWYRHEFTQAKSAGKRYFLCLDGINWKAEVYLNGTRLNDINGAFIRSRQDVTDILNDGRNALAIRIIHNAHPGAVKTKTAKWTGYNGGILGADSPTFLASIGWDWMTTVRGRNCGIWNDVRIEEKGTARLSDPLVRAAVGEDGKASVTVTVSLDSDGPAEVEGWIGDIRFSKTATDGEVTFGPDEFPQLKDTDLELWWPNGYGNPVLHEAGFKVKTDAGTADSLQYKAGLREITWTTDGGLKLYVNGRRINPMGGNWGFCQQNLRFSERDYLVAVEYHRHMNFNMIRNWVGQVAHDAFYKACDECGILVWQDFWLANPGDGPDPDDEAMFLANADDYVRRIRRHPCVALYCGRNEGYPPETLDRALKDEIVEPLHPGTPYISSSADGPVGGRGPYKACPVTDYFDDLEILHSERGMPNIPVFESLREIMDPEDLWPQSDMWGKHDFTMDGAQKAVTYNALVEKQFGEVKDAEQFAGLAQWINYDGYRAIFEGANSSGRHGMILWMSHCCWPSLVFFTYDYYFRTGGAYFGCKKACEPLHIQYNPVTGMAEVVNNGVGDVNEIWAKASTYDIHGESLSDYMAIINSPDDSTVPVIEVEKPANGEPYFISLRLSSQDGAVFSDNFYMIPGAVNGLRPLRDLPEAKLETEMEIADGALFMLVRNTDEIPALMLRLMLADGDTEILPAFYSDNYFSLMPGEEKVIMMSWPEDMRNIKPAVSIRQLASYND